MEQKQIVSIFTILQLFFLLSTACGAASSKQGCEDHWTSYDGEYCYRLFPNELLSFDQAIDFCTAYGSLSLLQLRTSQEQAYFSKELFFSGSELYDNVWLGANVKIVENSSQYFWPDEYGQLDEMEYNNWQTGHPKISTENSRLCVQLEGILEKESEEYKWITVSCSRRGVVICKKIMDWSNSKIRQEFIQIRKQIKTLNENPVPPGFIYTQLPWQSEPSAIWPQVTWTDVTSTYGGSFFRALGAGAEPFGTKQNENSPRLVKANSKLIPATADTEIKEVQIQVGRTSARLWTGDDVPGYKDLIATSFTMSGGETRPVNLGVKIWKRN